MFVSILLLPVFAVAFRTPIVPTGITRLPRAPQLSPTGRAVSSDSGGRGWSRLVNRIFGGGGGEQPTIPSDPDTPLALSPEEVKDVFDGLFKKLVLEVDVLRDPNHFNDPEVCMVRDPVDFMRGSFFSNLTEIVGTIVNATKEPPNPRSKPFVALMKGSGGGKTRLVEEVRRHLLSNYSNILPVAITFNSDWYFPNSIDCDIWSFIDKAPDLPPSAKCYTKLSMSVIIRILSMVYRQDMKIIGQGLMRSLLFRSMLSRMDERSSEFLLKGLVMHVIGKAKEGCPQIDSFVLLMDETAKMIVKDNSEFTNASTTRFMQEFHETLLNKEIRLNDQRINVGLLITSLRLGPLDEGQSSRTVYFLEPREPEVDEVVKDWWGLGWIDKLKEAGPVMDMYRMLASVFRRWMRSSEYVLTVLERRCHETFGLTLPQVGEKLDDAQWKAEKELEVRKLLENAADDMIDDWYLKGLNDQRSIPSNQQVFQMIFHQPSALNADSIFLVKDNFISDAINNIISAGTDETCGTVRHFNVSMFGLYLSAKNQGINENGPTTAADVVGIVQELNKLKNKIHDVKETGLLLEQFDQNYLWFRLKVATAAGKSSISLKQLLGADEDFHGFGPVMLKKGSMDVFHTISIQGTTAQFPAEIAKELMSIQVDEDCPYKIIIPNHSESFDFALKYYDRKAPGSSRLLFVVGIKCQGMRRDRHKDLSRVMAMTNQRYTRESCLFIYRATKTVNTTDAKHIATVDTEINDCDGDALSRKSRMEQETSGSMTQIHMNYARASTPTESVTDVDMPLMTHGVEAMRNYFGPFYEFFEICQSRIREKQKSTTDN